MFGFLISVQPTRAALDRDLNKLRDELKEFFDRLVPLDKNEIELLSLQQEDRTVKRGIGKLVKGVFSSIYHEALVAYAYKEYVATRKKAILMVKTYSHEFVYHVHGAMTDLFVNGEKIGQINAQGELRNNQKLLAEIKINDSLELAPIEINNRVVGRVRNPQFAGHVNPRAYNMLEEMNEDEELLFLSLSLLYMVQAQEES